MIFDDGQMAPISYQVSEDEPEREQDESIWWSVIDACDAPSLVVQSKYH